MNKIALGLLFSFLIVSLSYAQNTKIDITGTITDKRGDKLPGVTVYIKGTRMATTTDEKGVYNLYYETNNGSVYICTSYLGMAPQSIRYKNQKIINFVLSRDENTILEEVVIKANPNINDIDIRAKSGFVNQVDIKSVIEKPTINLGVSLQGNVPGLSIINTGELGSKPEIRIRGNSSFRQGNLANEPLYVLDGQVISAESFLALNPQDLEDIKVLKDAAACALYGVKAANGVIEVTSKRGYQGRTSITYSFNMGVTGKGPRSRRMMNSVDKLELERRMRSNKVITPGYFLSEDYINNESNSLQNIATNLSNNFRLPSDLSREEYAKLGNIYLDSLRTINTNWFDELMRVTLYQNHNLSLRGGSENLSYYSSVNYTQQGGQLPGNDQKRISARLSVDWILGKVGYLSLGVNSGYENIKSPNSSNYPLTELIYNLNPYETKNGKLISYPNRTFNDLMGQYKSTSDRKKAGSSLSFNLEPLKNLTISGSAGIDYLLSENKNITPSTAFEELQSGAKESEWGRISKEKNDDFNFSFNLRSNYNLVINEVHDITIGGNIDYYYASTDLLKVTGYGIGLLDELYAINQSIEGARKPKIGSYRDKNAQAGVGVLAGYTFRDTYDIFGTYKADASSILPKNKRWNAAWAIGLGVNIEQYPFLKDNKVLTQFNIKSSYGKTANLAGISAGITTPIFSYQNDYYGDHRILTLTSMYNDKLKPEQTASFEIGTSLTFYDRFNIGFQYYKRNTKEALLSVPIPSSNGFMDMTRNVGELSNEGYELNSSLEILNTYNWRVSAHANFSYNQNKVIDLYEGDKMFLSDEAIIPDYEVGKSYNILYGLKSLGIDPYNGYPVIVKDDGSQEYMNKPLTRSDFVNIGLSSPPMNGMFGVSASYKQLDFNCSFYYVLGGKKTYSFNYVRFPDNINKNAIQNQDKEMWFEEGDLDKIYPSPYIDTATANNMQLYPNSKMIARSDYLRLSTLSLRYRFPKKILQRLGIVQYASIGFQGSNLFTWTPYKSSSPEAGSLDIAIQPIYSFNLQITL